MKITKSVLASAVSAALLSAAAFAPAHAEISASAAVSNIYLWRGYDLGGTNGSPAVSGDIMFSNDSGVYAGVWGSSGDASLGTEYDVFAGWGGEFGSVSVDLSYWSYIYPNSDGVDGAELGFGDLADIVLSVGTGPVAVTLYEAIEGDDEEEYRYYTVDYSMDDVSFMYGVHDYEDSDNASHIQIGYSYDDNISFAVSKFVDGEDADNVNFLVSYSL